MEQGYILDTNIAIYLLQGRLSANAALLIKDFLKTKAKISIISKIELLSWEENSDVCLQFVNNSQIFVLEDSIIETTIEIRKKYKTKLPDAIIAATAIVHGLKLVTRNESDFKKIKELGWINPFDL